MSDKEEKLLEMMDHSTPEKKLSKLEKEAQTYEKAYNKLLLVVCLSTIFVIL